MYWILLLGLALAWILQTILIRRMWQQGLSVELRFRARYIYEGDSCALQEIVTNDKWIPLPALEVRIAMSRHLAFTGESVQNSGVSDQTYKRDVFSFLFHQQVTRTLSFTGKKRGCYEIRQADLKAYDFFFRPLDYATVPQSTMLYVYPAQIDTKRLNIITTAISGTILVQNKLFPDPFEFSGIREYQHTDPMNHINWKATMRMGTPLVNQFDSTTSLDLNLIFDMEDSHIRKEEALLEETIRIVSSLAARLVAARMPRVLDSNAAVGSEETQLSPVELPANGSHMSELNQQLACINGYTVSCTKLLDSIELSKQKKQMHVFISKNTDEEIIRSVGGLATALGPVLWIIPKSPYTRQPDITLPFVQTIFWEVEL